MLMGEYIMIEKFKVNNYKGFNEEIVLDLSKTRDYAFNSELIKNGLVNKGIIYGKNGSGKSNLGFALYDVTSHLTDKQKPMDIFTTNYINLDNKEDVAIFTYEFKFGNDRITYEYAKTNINNLTYEIVTKNNEVVVKHIVLNKNVDDDIKYLVFENKKEYDYFLERLTTKYVSLNLDNCLLNKSKSIALIDSKS